MPTDAPAAPPTKTKRPRGRPRRLTDEERRQRQNARMRKVNARAADRAHAGRDRARRPNIHRAGDELAADMAMSGLTITDARANRSPLFRVEMPDGQIRWENIKGEILHRKGQRAAAKWREIEREHEGETQ
jgi:hypothetical protein